MTRWRDPESWPTSQYVRAIIIILATFMLLAMSARELLDR